MKKLKKVGLLFAVFALASCSKDGEDNPTTTPNPTPTPTPVVQYPGVYTLAGSGTKGLKNGIGNSAEFNDPNGVAVDALGNVYVADYSNNLIRKITPAGEASTFAGTGTGGSTNGAGAVASFNNPIAVAVDASGNVYVSDYGNQKIRKITPSGVVSTLAGSGTKGSDDGTDIGASFGGPKGIAVDASGNVYVADSENHKIRKITSAGVVTTLAGSTMSGSADGTGASASFKNPSGLGIDKSGNLYVSEENQKIRKITPAGVVTTLAGSGSVGSTNGLANRASFNSPEGVAIDGAGNVYVADKNNNLIRKISNLGEVTTIAGTTEGNIDGTFDTSKFKNPTGMCITAQGVLYVGDTGNHKIRKIVLSSGSATDM